MPALAETIDRNEPTSSHAIPKPSDPHAHVEPDRVGRDRVLENDRLSRIRYLIASAYGVGADELASPPSSVKAALARSLAIAVARDILATDLAALAGHFGCSGAAEAAEHCNRIARRSQADHRLAIMATFARASCAVALGLDL